MPCSITFPGLDVHVDIFGRPPFYLPHQVMKRCLLICKQGLRSSFFFFSFCRNIVKEFLKSRDFTQRRDCNRYNFKLYNKTIGEIFRTSLRYCQVSKSHLTGGLLFSMHYVLCINNNKKLSLKFNVVRKNVCVSLIKH